MIGAVFVALLAVSLWGDPALAQVLLNLSSPQEGLFVEGDVVLVFPRVSVSQVELVHGGRRSRIPLERRSEGGDDVWRFVFPGGVRGEVELLVGGDRVRGFALTKKDPVVRYAIALEDGVLIMGDNLQEGYLVGPGSQRVPLRGGPSVLAGQVRLPAGSGFFVEFPSGQRSNDFSLVPPYRSRPVRGRWLGRPGSGLEANGTPISPEGDFELEVGEGDAEIVRVSRGEEILGMAMVFPGDGFVEVSGLSTMATLACMALISANPSASVEEQREVYRRVMEAGPPALRLYRDRDMAEIVKATQLMEEVVRLLPRDVLEVLEKW